MPLARTADLFLPVRPGADSALLNAILHEVIALGWLDHEFIDAHTIGFEEVLAPPPTRPRVGERDPGIPAARIGEAAELWGPRRPR